MRWGWAARVAQEHIKGDEYCNKSPAPQQLPKHRMHQRLRAGWQQQGWKTSPPHENSTSATWRISHSLRGEHRGQNCFADHTQSQRASHLPSRFANRPPAAPLLIFFSSFTEKNTQCPYLKHSGGVWHKLVIRLSYYKNFDICKEGEKASGIPRAVKSCLRIQRRLIRNQINW